MQSKSKTPFVTLALILINIAVAFWVLVTVGGVEKYGFDAAKPSPIGAFTSLFVHANVIHLLGNMVFLAAVGVAVEIATGSTRFSIVYLASGLLGVAVYWMAVRNSTQPLPLVGASGAIAGCATYYSLRYTNLRVPLAPKKSATVAVITLLWLILQLIGAFVSIGQAVSGSSFFAHLGGALGGILLGIFFKAPDLGNRKLGHQVLEQLNDRGPHAQIEHAKTHLAEHPDDAEMLVNLAEAYEEVGEADNEAETWLKSLFKLSPEAQPRAIERLAALKKLDQIPVVKRRQLADKLKGPTGITLLNSIVALPKTESQRPDAILELATLLKDSKPEQSTQLLAQLETEYPSHPITELAAKRGLL